MRISREYTQMRASEVHLILLKWMDPIVLFQIFTCIPKSRFDQWILFQAWIVTCHFGWWIWLYLGFSSYTYDLTHTLQFNFIQQSRNTTTDETDQENVCFGTRYEPTWKYVWNQYLLEPLRSQVHSRWLLWIIHGRRNVSLEYSRKTSFIYVWLIFRCHSSIQPQCLLSFSLFNFDLSTITTILRYTIS